MKNTKELLAIHHGLKAIALMEEPKFKVNGLFIYKIADYEVKINFRVNEYFIECIECKECYERFELKVMLGTVVHFKTNIKKEERIKEVLNDLIQQMFWGYQQRDED